MMGRLPKHLTREEIECPCGCGFAGLTDGIKTLWTVVRERVGKPIIVTSGCRCEAYNDHLRSLGYPAARLSEHLRGNALDMRTPIGMTTQRFAEIVEACVGRLGGIGIGKSFVHMDARYFSLPSDQRPAKPARWSY